MAARAIEIEWFWRPPRFWIGDAYAAMGLLAWVVAWALPLMPALQAIWPACHFQQIVGVPCGTCGLTRVFVHGARFHLEAAFLASPLGAVAFYLGSVASLWVAASWVWRRLPIPLLSLRSRGVWLFVLALFLGNWAYLVWREAL